MDTLELDKDNVQPTVEVATITETSDIEQIIKRIEYPATQETEHDAVSESSSASYNADELLLPAQDVDTKEDDTDEEIIETPTSESALHNSTLTKEELIEHLRTLVNQNVESIKSELDSIKQNFYRSINTENEVLREKFIADGGAPDDFVPQKDELEETFKSILSEIKEKRAEHTARIEKQKEQNLLEKQHIISQMKMLVEKNNDVDKAIREFRELQQKWKNLGAVPATQVNVLWREYTQCQEAFWDLVKINNELREYDFRKNLELKNVLIDAAEKLAAEKEIIPAFKKLQKLHDDWREIGPVARELRDEVWNKFRIASSVVNKRHVEYFENLRKNEDENTAAKQALIEKINSFDTSDLKTFKQWEEASNQIFELQKQWRTTGFASRRINRKLFEKYRKACDKFFDVKAAFFKDVRSEFSANIEKKTLLCKRAEELKDSTEWRETTAILVGLQKEWKQTGSVPRKFSDSLWERFSSACDHFFEHKKAATLDNSVDEKENLVKKRDIIARIKALNITDQVDALKLLKEMIVEWNSVGFVPFKEKENLHREYRAAVDSQFDALNVDASARRLDTFRNNLAGMVAQGGRKLQDEYRRLSYTFEHLKQELNTYENNLGFLTTSSKQGNGLIDQMNKKIENLRNECKLLQNKMKLLEKEMK
ncbi:MAG: DUF349 domain-containing protein [Prevotellaceae bacterium]|jgi:hypothetical protein|nr:DUF349 domain-containing protein [Prevotellaceae bacterium]